MAEEKLPPIITRIDREIERLGKARVEMMERYQARQESK